MKRIEEFSLYTGDNDESVHFKRSSIGVMS